MEYNFLIGDRIILTLKNGTSYEGDVKNFNQASQRVSLKNILQQPGSLRVDGRRNFEISEISYLKKILNHDCGAVDLTDSECNRNGDDTCTSKTLNLKLSNEEYNKILDVQKYSQYIFRISKEFYEAIRILKEHEVIGVCVKDISSGRSHRASVIAVATENIVFIFDLFTLGDKGFDEGLGQILQSAFIQKVIYDCRLVSDCLFHKHNVQLINVRDVEAEDVMLVHQERGTVRQHTRSFGYLVELYLGIPSEIVEESMDVCKRWNKRPLGVENQKYLALHASLLIHLHKAIEKKYLRRLLDASSIYNECIKNADEFDYVIYESKYVPYDKLRELVRHLKVCRRIAKMTD